jgi:hypothetical protein
MKSSPYFLINSMFLSISGATVITTGIATFFLIVFKKGSLIGIINFSS